MPPKILIIDDEPMNVELLEYILRLEGIQNVFGKFRGHGSPHWPGRPAGFDPARCHDAG